MFFPFSAWLRVVEPLLTPPFFQPRAVAGLLTLAESLPGETLGILEVRLADGDPAIDLSLRLETAEEARAAAGLVRAPHIRRFLEEYAAEGGPFSPLPAVWIELDQLPDFSYRSDPVLCARLPSTADPEWVAGTLLPALRGSPLAGPQRRTFLRCCGALPPGAGLLYVYGFQARGHDAVRMEVHGLPAGEMAAYLRRVAPAAVPAAEEWAPVFAGVERIHLSFDVEEEVLPRIGIEGSFPLQPRREPRWAQLLARLTDPVRQAVVLAWPGQDSFWSAAARWPTGWLGGGGRLARGVSHCKVAAGEGPAVAKVYLCLQEIGSPGLPLRPVVGLPVADRPS